MTNRVSRRGIAGLAAILPAAAMAGSAQAQQGAYGPENIVAVLGRLKLRCAVALTCPVSSVTYQDMQRAAAGDSAAQYSLALALQLGSGAPRDETAVWRKGFHGRVSWAGQVGRLKVKGPNQGSFP